MPYLIHFTRLVHVMNMDDRFIPEDFIKYYNELSDSERKLQIQKIAELFLLCFKLHDKDKQEELEDFFYNLPTHDKVQNDMHFRNEDSLWFRGKRLMNETSCYKINGRIFFKHKDVPCKRRVMKTLGVKKNTFAGNMISRVYDYYFQGAINLKKEYRKYYQERILLCRKVHRRTF